MKCTCANSFYCKQCSTARRWDSDLQELATSKRRWVHFNSSDYRDIYNALGMMYDLYTTDD